MRKPNRFVTGAVALLTALVLAAVPLCVPGFAQGDDSKEQMAALNENLERLSREAKEIQAQLNQASGKKQQKAAVVTQIDGQIDNTAEQIEVLDERVSLLEQRVSQKEAEHRAKQKEIDKDLDLFKKRLRAMYKSGGATNNVGLLLGADSYSQFLMRAETVSCVAQHDQELLARLENEKRELEVVQREIEENKAGVEADKTTLEGKKTELKEQYQQANAQLQDIALVEQEYKTASAAKKAEMQKIQAELDAIFAEINRNSSSPYVGGEMLWPVPSLSMVTSEFGNRGDFHTGIDISGSGAYGAAVVAANSGTVKVANTQYRTGVGYGKYLAIDHGGGIQTLYGHCSALNVSVGQFVSRGEKIAEVGSTGWVTGPHLHFEVRKNGSAVNPNPYVGR